MEAARSGDRTQREVGCVAPMRVATAVPHEPAPITATRSLFMHKRLRRPRGALGLHPYTVSVSRVSARTADASVRTRTSAPRSSSYPVKAFHQAKRRLDPVLSEAERERLVRTMAAHVVAACAPLPVAVVCDDEEVATWAADLGATVLWEPGRGSTERCGPASGGSPAAGARWVTDRPRRPAPRPRPGHPCPLRRRHPGAGP